MSAKSAVDAYREQLRGLAPADREAFLRAESRLPGPRGNLELLAAAVAICSPEEFQRWATLNAGAAPGNTPGEFVATVGAAGLGRLVVEGRDEELVSLRRLASDPRWRVREGVAMAVQRIGAHDFTRLLAIASEWADGNRYEQRAAVAGLAEPPILRAGDLMRAAFDVFDWITESVIGADDAKTDGFAALSKALGYGWSVLVAVAPDIGRPRMERWLGSSDPAVRRIMRATLSKNRLARMDAAWVARWQERLGIR